MSVGLQRLRDEPDVIRRGAIDKGEDPALVDRALELDARRRRLLGESEALKAERNAASKRIGEAIKGGAAPDGPEVAELKADVDRRPGERIKALDAELAEVEAALDDLLLRIPNPADPDVPVGGEEANVTIRTWGELLPTTQPVDGRGRRRRPGRRRDLDPQAALGARRGARHPRQRARREDRRLGLPGLQGRGLRRSSGPDQLVPRRPHPRARLHRGLAAGRRQHGDSARGTGQIPDKEDQMYVVTRDELYLVPTAEVPVTNLHRDEILEAADLPIRYAAYSPCFRREAGAAGKDTRGILRVHQFDKVEMVLFERPEDSPAALEWMTERAEILLQRLGLAYRVLLMSTREMGFTQARKYDLEVWAPGVERWLEVSSCSNFRDYQARRMAIRYRPEAGAKAELLHTLNGSGLALPRVVAAMLETYQQPDGSVTVPEVLRPYLGARPHRLISGGARRALTRMAAGAPHERPVGGESPRAYARVTNARAENCPFRVRLRTADPPPCPAPPRLWRLPRAGRRHGFGAGLDGHVPLHGSGHAMPSSAATSPPFACSSPGSSSPGPT